MPQINEFSWLSSSSIMVALLLIYFFLFSFFMLLKNFQYRLFLYLFSFNHF